MSTIKFTVPIMPVTWPRPRFDRRNKTVFNSQHYTEYKDALAIFARQAMCGLEPLRGEVRLYAEFYRPKPKPRKDKPQVSFIGDVDRYLNAVLDALIGICYFDDRQIVVIGGKKIFGSPHIFIELEKLQC